LHFRGRPGGEISLRRKIEQEIQASNDNNNNMQAIWLMDLLCIVIFQSRTRHFWRQARKTPSVEKEQSHDKI